MKDHKHNEFYDSKLTRSPRFRTEFGRDGDEWARSVGDLGAGANRVGGYSVGAVHDRVADAARRDFTEFRTGDMAARGATLAEAKDVSGGKHVGATTIIYETPPTGWSDDGGAMRKSKGGMSAIIGSGLERVEDEIRRGGGSILDGYRVAGGLLNEQKGLRGVLRATVNENNSDIGLRGGNQEQERDGVEL